MNQQTDIESQVINYNIVLDLAITVAERKLTTICLHAAGDIEICHFSIMCVYTFPMCRKLTKLSNKSSKELQHLYKEMKYDAEITQKIQRVQARGLQC